MNNIIFLDIDGVLNCQTFFESYHNSKKVLRKQLKSNEIDKSDYYKSQLCVERIMWLNKLCADTKANVVISSTWRKNKTVEELQEILNNSGATFKIIGKTGIDESRIRGVEISKYLDHYRGELKLDCEYVIIDDDSDMLLQQQHNFFQTDNYSGLTPNTCYKISLFFESKIK